MTEQAPRTYKARHVIAASPWDVYELLTDRDEQAQWRDRFARQLDIVEEEPYTRVAFDDGLVMWIEPEGEKTLLRCETPKSGNGLTGRFGRWFTSRKSVEEELLAQLKRIGATAEHRGI